MMGRGYIIDHVISALKCLKQKETYQNYITDALMYIVNNTAGQDTRYSIKVPYRDLIVPSNNVNSEDNDKKAEEIKNRIKSKLRGG